MRGGQPLPPVPRRHPAEDPCRVSHTTLPLSPPLSPALPTLMLGPPLSPTLILLLSFLPRVQPLQALLSTHRGFLRRQAGALEVWTTWTLPSRGPLPGNGPILLARHLGRRAPLVCVLPRMPIVNQPAIPRAPLCPLPLIEVPFERIGMDLIEPFHRSARRYRFVLVLVLRTISAKSVAQVLFQVISRVGIPKEILIDQGTQLVSQTLGELYGLLGIKSSRTSVYHPQTDGLVEHLNKTLNSMIRKFVHKDSRNWDRWLDPLLFAVREVPQASTGFSPFELLFGRKPCRVLDLVKES